MKAETYNAVIEQSKNKIRKDTSFVRRNYPVFWIALGIYVLATCLSASSIFAHLQIRASETFASGISTILAAAGTLIVIALQFMLKYFVDDIQAGSHNKGGGDFAMMIFKGVMGVIGIVFGVMLSLGGAEKVVGYMAKKNTSINVDLVSIDSIQSIYNAKTEKYQQTQSAYLNNKWKGNTTAPALRQSAKYTDILANLESERANAIASAELKNSEAMAEYKVDVQGNKTQAMRWMGIAEGAIVLCVILIGIFDDGVKREAKDLGVTVKSTF
jgi:hypothetical protein